MICSRRIPPVLLTGFFFFSEGWDGEASLVKWLELMVILLSSAITSELFDLKMGKNSRYPDQHCIGYRPNTVQGRGAGDLISG